MHRPNRDLLVLLKQELMTPQAMEFAVEKLHIMLQQVETSPDIFLAYELIDVNKYKVSNKQLHLQSYFQQRKPPPFVFLNCKN